MAIRFPKLSLELFLMKKEAERSFQTGELSGVLIQWPEILQKDLDFWLSKPTQIQRISCAGGAVAATLTLPPVFSAANPRTWLATRNNEKSQCGSNEKWLSRSSAVKVEPSPAKKTSAETLANLDLWLQTTNNCVESSKPEPTAATHAPYLNTDKLLSKATASHGPNPTADKLLVKAASSHTLNPTDEKLPVKNDVFCTDNLDIKKLLFKTASATAKQTDPLSIWLLKDSKNDASFPKPDPTKWNEFNKPTVHEKSIVLDSSYSESRQNQLEAKLSPWLAKNLSSVGLKPKEKTQILSSNDKWLSKSNIKPLSKNTKSEDAKPSEAVLRGFEKLSLNFDQPRESKEILEFSPGSIYFSSYPGEDTTSSVSSVRSWLLGDNLEEDRWLEDYSEGSIVTLDMEELDRGTEMSEDAVLVDRTELEKWLL